MMDDLAVEVLQDFGRLSNRGTWENYWEDIAEVLWPNMRYSFRAGSRKTDGDRLTEYQVDSTPQLALSRFRAIMTSLLTPDTQKWHYLRASNDDLNKVREVGEWFETVNDTLFRMRKDTGANFRMQIGQVYAGLGAFGTSTLFVDRMPNRLGLRYRTIHVGETYIREDHSGEVDTLIRRFELTARQAAQRLDWQGKLPDNIVQAADKNPDAMFTFFHRVRQNPNYDPEDFTPETMRYESVYVCESGKCVLTKGGYNSMPYAVARYEVAPGEVYGRSPAMQALPAIKTLMAQKRAHLKAGHRATDPVLLAADDNILNNTSLRPGAIVPGAVSLDGKPLLQILPTGDVRYTEEMMEAERLVINDTFLVRLMQVISETGSDRKTATEVLELAQERATLLEPTVGAQNDFLGKIIDREVDILVRNGLVPPMPRELQEAAGEYSIQFDNPISRAADSSQIAGVMRNLEMILPVINITQDPSVLDRYDFDKVLELADRVNNVPFKVTRSLDEINQIRQGRAQQAERAAQAQEAPGQAALLKAAADAKTKGLRAEDLQ